MELTGARLVVTRWHSGLKVGVEWQDWPKVGAGRDRRVRSDWGWDKQRPESESAQVHMAEVGLG